MVWDDLKRFRLSQTARQAVSEDTAGVVWDDLKRFRLFPTHFAPTSARVNRTCSNAEGFGGLGFRGSHCHPDTRPSGFGRLETFQVLMSFVDPVARMF